VPTFKPSPVSTLDPREAALGALRYLRKASLHLEKEIEEGTPLPGWLLARISQAAGLLGSGVAYTRRKK
tara:strand:- start:1480 stop:1686 length:207 start_codon:yes stop_codon:yes gene_type:complete